MENLESKTNQNFRNYVVGSGMSFLSAYTSNVAIDCIQRKEYLLAGAFGLMSALQAAYVYYIGKEIAKNP
jgi:hypothetical protein